jgi:hypothetical protein
MTKKYINSWRQYEAPYVQAMAMAGVSREDCEDRLWAVNKRLNVPYRSDNVIAKMAAGAFKEAAKNKRQTETIARYNMIERYIKKHKDCTFAHAATIFGCSVSTVTAAIRYVRKTNDIKGFAWAEWETFYCVELRKQGLEYDEIYRRLWPISQKLRRQIRTKHAIAERVQKTRRLRRAKET